jgi:hypothetical protein
MGREKKRKALAANGASAHHGQPSGTLTVALAPELQDTLGCAMLDVRFASYESSSLTQTRMYCVFPLQ